MRGQAGRAHVGDATVLSAAFAAEQASKRLTRLRMVRGASRRTHRQIKQAAAVLLAAAGLIHGEAAFAEPPNFVPPDPVYRIQGYEPTFVDIDGDGDLDAFTGYIYGGIAFFENIGDASSPLFAASSSAPFGLTSLSDRSPTFADLDGDGDLDAVIGQFSDQIVYYENQGDPSNPSFAASSNALGVSAGYNPVFADIDSDGDLDLFSGERNGNTVFFLNTGNSSAPAFAGSSENALGLADVGFDASPAFADIDDDGDLDAFIGNEDGDTVFFENTGNSTFPIFAAPSTNPFGLADVGDISMPTFADIDGDGDLDAVINQDQDILEGEQLIPSTFFENTGSATSPAFAIPATPFDSVTVYNFASPELVDIDGDGDLDAFVGNTAGDTTFFENTGTLWFPAFAASAVNPFGLTDVGTSNRPALVDIDSDGDLDALFGRFGPIITDRGTAFFENTGNGTSPAFAASIANPFGLTTGSESLAFADIDSDGDLDILSYEYPVEEFVFFENTGNSTAPAFAASSAAPFGLGSGLPNWASLALADIDGDGDVDMLAGDYEGHTYLYENTGDATSPAFAAGVRDPFGLTDVGWAADPTFVDVDGDGDLDGVIGDRYGNVVFFENAEPDEGLFAAPTANPFGLTSAVAWSRPEFVDIDGDGDFDAFVGDGSGSTIFFENTGDASSPAFAASSLDPFGLVDVGIASSPSFVDIDGDGDFDAFLGNLSGSTVFFENTGNSSSPQFAAPIGNPFGLTPVNGYNNPVFVDIDGDGDLDLFVGAALGEIVFFENTGTNTAPAFGVGAVTFGFAGSSLNPFGLLDVGFRNAPEFADLDGDGDMDAFIGEGYGSVIYFVNTGNSSSPAFTTSGANPFGLIDVGERSGPAFVDIDADGDVDMFVGEASGDVFFFENDSPPSAACAPSPATCSEGFDKALLVVKEKKAGKEKIVAKLVKGPAATQSDFGNPLGVDGTQVRLCIYGDDGTLAGELAVDRAGQLCDGKPCWRPIGGDPPDGKGFKFKDKSTSSDGVKIVKLKAGDTGKTLALVKAANNSAKGLSSMPTGITAELAGDAFATLQVATSDGDCFSAQVDDIKRADSDFFKGKK